MSFKIYIAAAEQSKITTLRLFKLLTYGIYSSKILNSKTLSYEEMTLFVCGDKIIDIRRQGFENNLRWYKDI